MPNKAAKGHIPGPYRVEKSYVSAERGVSNGWNIWGKGTMGTHVKNSDDLFICKVSNVHPDAEGTAILMSTSLEMLEALKTITLELEETIPGLKGNLAGAGLGVTYKWIKQLIPKAEGR